jgi:methyl-accepting chemotaxis protein
MPQAQEQTKIYVAPDGTADDRLNRAARTLPRRRFFSDMPDKGLFVFAAGAGFAGIIYFKLHFFGANYVAGGAVALMVLYGLLAYQLPKVRMRLDRLGDNFYYLGFLYTLASLSAALIQLQERSAAIDDLLGSFGIALFTTIVGVAGRVLFVQMRGDLDEVEDEVRRDLLNASADLRAQLSIALSEFETFHTGVRQAGTKLAEETPSAAKQAIDKIEEVAVTAADHIERAFAAEKAKIQTLSEAVTRITTAVEDLTDELREQMGDFGGRLDQMLSQLANTVDRIDRYGAKRRRWYWPFSRR